MRTEGDKDALLVKQEAALIICDAKRAGAVSTIDAANERAKPKRRFWPF